MNTTFAAWRKRTAEALRGLDKGCHPKQVIAELSEGLLAHYADRPLVDVYDVYQRLMDYWAETMQDDCYLIAADGWKAETTRVLAKNAKGKEVDRGWACDLIPKPPIVARYFAAEQAQIDQLTAELESASAELAELEEEEGGEDGAFAELDKVNKASVNARLREAKAIYNVNGAADDEMAALDKWLELSVREAELKRRLREAEADLDVKAYAKYPALSEAEVQTLVVDDKWLAALAGAIHGETERISQALTQRVRELADRYETPLPALAERAAEMEQRVARHLERMGFTWQ
jgi:type I restriction enzyme M protein